MLTLLFIIGVLVGLISVVIAMYNKLIRLRNTVKSSWSDIDVQLKKRYDLVPNLVETVKGRWWGPPIAAVLEVVLLVVMTGAFHLDGLGDTADGLFSHRQKEKMLEIMNDSRIGAMGVVAICSVLAVKWAGLTGLRDHRLLLLILVPAYARCGILLAMRFLEYGRPGGGLGLPFFGRRLGLRQFWGVAATLALSIGLGLQAAWLNLAFFLMAAAIIGYYRKRLNCITGDMLGALTEVTEAGLFLIASMGGSR